VAQGWTELSRESAELGALQAALTGKFVFSGSAEYELACKSGWNGISAEQRPIGFVYCANTNDVVHAVNFARKNHPHVIVRYSDGDNRALCDGALVLDLSMMKSCRVWPCDGVALVEPGLSFEELNEKTMQHGLAVPGPEGAAGIAASTMSGAGGILSRQYGLSCDNLLEAEVVTTDGGVIRCKADENPDLFWAIRGGGEYLGVVTSFLFKLNPVHDLVYAGNLVYPVEWSKEIKRAKAVYETWAELQDCLPPNCSIFATLGTPPVGSGARPSVASSAVHKPSWGSVITMQETSDTHAYAHPCLVLTCFCNGPIDEQTTTVFQSLVSHKPVINTLGLMPYSEALDLTAWAKPHGDRFFHEGAVLQGLSWDIMDMAIQAVRKSARLTVSLPDFTGGAVESVDADAMAFPHRNSYPTMLITSHWTDLNDDATSITTVQALRAQVENSGVTTGACHLAHFVDKIDELQAWGPQHTRRMAELRTEYDPAMVLMANHPQ